MLRNFRLDRQGIAEILNSPEIADLMEDKAYDVAAGVEASGTWVRHGDRGDVIVERYTTDRAAAAVVVAHPGGIAMQAKHGVLTRAAAAAGLDVNEEAVV